MIANHTGIRTVFKSLYEQYKTFRRKDAFLDQYKQTRLFNDNLKEFDESAEVVKNLIDEYEASEKANYISYG